MLSENKQSVFSAKVLFAVAAFYVFVACMLTGAALFGWCDTFVGSSGIKAVEQLNNISASLRSGPEHFSLVPPAAYYLLMAIFGDSYAYNILVVIVLAVAAFGGYLLCFRVSGAVLESVVGGLIFGFSPLLQTEVSNGMIQQVMGQALMPLLALALLNLNKTGSFMLVVLAAVISLVAELCWPYSAFQALIITLIFLMAGWFGAEAGQKKNILYRYLCMVIAMALPLILIRLAGGASTSSAGHGLRDMSVNIFRLVSYPESGEWSLMFNEQAGLMPYNVYMGKIVILFSVFACLLFDKSYRVWKYGLLIFILLSLGVVLNIGGNTAPGGLTIYLPGRILAAVSERVFALHSHTFMSAAMMFAAVLTACSLSRVFGALFSGRARIIVFAFIGWLILADFSMPDNRNQGLLLPSVRASSPSSLNVIQQK